jgi:hypothetical protein
MHTQLKEILVYKGKEFPVSADPLSQYFTSENSPRFFKNLRANKRGYLGKWAVIKNELFLTSLSGELENADEISLENVFPGKERVFAEWFNGEIILNLGKLLALANKDRPAVYASDLHLEFIKGRLINTQIVENTLDSQNVDSYSL